MTHRADRAEEFTRPYTHVVYLREHLNVVYGDGCVATENREEAREPCVIDVACLRACVPAFGLIWIVKFHHPAQESRARWSAKYQPMCILPGALPLRVEFLTRLGYRVVIKTVSLLPHLRPVLRLVVRREY